MKKLEKDYQAKIKIRLISELPGCTVLKNDTDHFQGIPDLIILHGNKWAMLEIKRSQNAKHRPNQDFYVDKFNSKGFASFIYPENEEEVIKSLKKYFEVSK